jgi:hypothetical protein
MPATPPRPPSGGPSRTALKAAGLVAIAVVSGLVWWLIRHGGGEAAAGQTPSEGEFTFATAEGPVVASDCAGHSYGSTRKWFAEHPCQHLSRALYVTETVGSRALVSVSLVTMPTAQEAHQLQTITQTDNTGNVEDLVKDGTAKIPGAPKVASGDYQSRVNGNEVTIVEAEFFGGHKDDALLQRISVDALRLSDRQR